MRQSLIIQLLVFSLETSQLSVLSAGVTDIHHFILIHNVIDMPGSIAQFFLIPVECGVVLVTFSNEQNVGGEDVTLQKSNSADHLIKWSRLILPGLSH